MDLHAFVRDSRPVEPASRGGALRGMEIALKDLFAVRGHVSSFGHEAWRATHAPAARHASVVEKALGEGARIVGLAKLDQLAYSLVGNVGEGAAPVNSFRPRSFCGGSSSGSASAIAGGLAGVGVGTDTGGSMRIPAAVCGLYGLRPTHGAIDVEGAIPLAPTFDAVGLCAASLEPVQALHRVLAGGDPVDFEEVLVAGVGSAATREVVLGYGRALADRLTAPLVRVSFGQFASTGAAELFGRVQGREIWQLHGKWLEAYGDRLDDDVRIRTERCKALSQENGWPDLERRRAYSERLRGMLGRRRVLLLPAVPDAGPGRDWSPERLAAFRGECLRLTAASSLSGLPQLVVRLPERLVRDDVTAVSLIGPAGSDRALMTLARELEESLA